MKTTRQTLTLSLALSTLLLCPACKTRPQTNHVQNLLNHPQFPLAREHAPDWAKSALTTVNDLQRELAKEKADPSK